MTRCIGYGPYDSRRKDGTACANEADTPAGLWCRRCEALRRKAITAQMREMTRRFEKERR